MPINSVHPEYKKMSPLITKTQHAFDGCVKEYVPRLSGQSNQEYEAYVNRASYYNLTERTAVALLGALNRKPHSIEYVYGDEPVCADDQSFDELVSECYLDLLLTGRVGLLCDFNEALDTPYLVNYDGHTIINWSEHYIVLMEHYYGVNPDDKYEVIQHCQYRELFIDQDGYYSVNIWRQQGGKNGKYSIYQNFQPMYRGQRLEAIPFVVVNPCEVSWETQKPVLSTLADINVEHFKLSTDLANGAHFLAIPTPWVAGQLDTDAQQVKMGTSEFIQLVSGGQVGFLEFTGKGLGFLKEMITQKEEYMYNLGSRMLQFKKGVESSDALSLRLGAEGAVLTSLANSLEEGLKQILEVYNSWFGITDTEVEVSLNKDFSPTNITPQEMAGLLQLFQADAISLDTLLKRLYEGEIVDDVQEELEMLTGQEEPDEAQESAIEGPNSEEANSQEEVDKYQRDSIIRAKSKL